MSRNNWFGATIVAGAIASLWIACGPAARPAATGSGENGGSGTGELGTSGGGYAGGAARNGEDDPCAEAPDYLECAVKRAQLTTDLLDQLGKLRGSTEPEAKAIALRALKYPDSVVEASAVRALSGFVADPDVSALLRERLLGDIPALQAAAVDAYLWSDQRDDLVDLWRRGHNGSSHFGPSPARPAQWGFPEPKTFHSFAPIESPRVVAIRTKEPYAAVATLYAKAALQSFKGDEYRVYFDGKMKASFATPEDTKARMSEMQKLTELYQKTKDPKYLQQIQELGTRYQEEDAKRAKPDLSIYELLELIPQDAQRTATYFVAERRGSNDVRFGAIWEDSRIHETVIACTWSATLGLADRVPAAARPVPF